MNIDLAILLLSTAGGFAMLAFTAGKVGGYVTQPRAVKGMPVGKSPTPGEAEPTEPKKPDVPKPDKPGDPDPKPKPDPPPKPKVPGGDPNAKPPTIIPMCDWDLLNPDILAATAQEAEPYAIARIPIPWPAINTGDFNIAKATGVKDGMSVGTYEYYLTCVVTHTLLQQGIDPDQFARGGIYFPGCLFAGANLSDDTPLGKLRLAWHKGA